MKEIWQSIKEFVRKTRKLSSLEGVVLYGSVAKGEPNPRDVDLLLIFNHPEPDEAYSKKIAKTITEINPPVPLKPVLTNLNDVEPSFLRSVMEEGKILRGKFVLDTKKSALRHYKIVSYSLKNLSNGAKMSIHRRVYGYKSKKVVKDKKYTYERKGLKDLDDVFMLGRGVIALPAKKATDFIEFLERENAAYDAITAWI